MHHYFIISFKLEEKTLKPCNKVWLYIDLYNDFTKIIYNFKAIELVYLG